jgi:glutaminyl-peptide cyclotransferase
MRQRIIALILLLTFAAGGVFYLFFKKDLPKVPIDNSATIAAPVALRANILNVYPHDTAAFTQGLQWFNGFLYEGTGQFEQSSLRKVELATGKVLQKTELGKAFFGEGITILNDKIYQLTWQNHIGFVYNLKDFKQLKTFDVPTEGWGITNNGKQLIISDGTNYLYYYDTATLKETSRISVQDNNGLLSNINELEWIDGYVFANIWSTNYIVKIDPVSGHVIAKADLTEQMQSTLPKGFYWQYEKVLNGIAYDTAAKKIYITGKYWPNLFEVRFD